MVRGFGEGRTGRDLLRVGGGGAGRKVERKNSEETKPGEIRSGYEI